MNSSNRPKQSEAFSQTRPKYFIQQEWQHAERCRGGRQVGAVGEHTLSSSWDFCSNKALKGADKRSLRPDTISDIISALCIPLHNDSISARLSIYLFVLLAQWIWGRSNFFWLESTLGKLRETWETAWWHGGILRKMPCICSHCAALLNWVDVPGQITQGSTPLPRTGRPPPPRPRSGRGRSHCAPSSYKLRFFFMY